MKAEYCGGEMGIQAPFSCVEAQGGFVQMDDRSIQLCVKHPKVPRIDVAIPYEEIYDISFVPGNWWHNGFLCVREKKKHHILLPRRFGEQRLGDTLVFFDKKKNDVFCQVYIYLKQRISNK